MAEDYIADARENLFQSFHTKFSSSFYVISLAWKISCCLSTNHNAEVRCLICTGITLFALVLYCATVELHRSQLIRIECLFHVYY